jgi:uncharacterized membrane protein YebE (DUF533 family)
MRIFGKGKPSFYQEQKDRIIKELALTKPGTDEYKNLMSMLTELQKLCGKEKLDRDGKKMIVGKVLGFGGIAALLFGMFKSEKVDGSMLSGGNATAGKGLIGGAIKLMDWLG